MKNKACCEKFVDVGGLKFVFPMLMNRGLNKELLRKKQSSMKRDIEQSVISVITDLCVQLHDSTKNDYGLRLFNKFIEEGYHKLGKCVELFLKYDTLLKQKEEEIDTKRQELQDANDLEALEEFEDMDNINEERLNAGLFQLQQLCIILTGVCIYRKDCLQQLEVKLSAADLNLNDVLSVLRELVYSLSVSEGTVNRNDASSSKEAVTTAEDIDDGNGYRKLLIEWCAILATLV